MTIGRIALLFCAAIWCACGAFALAALVGRARRAMRRYGVSARVVFLLAAAACVMLAGGKGGSVAVHDDYIADAGSYLTNDVAHVAIAKRTPNLPDSTEILVYARELSSTNAADWFRLSPHLTFADHPYDYSLPNATNYSVLVSSSFVPEPTVHTNGVWALRGFEIPGHAGRYAFGNSRVHRDVPYDAEVEYLESTGTQWIDTGYSFNSATDSVELTFELLSSTPVYKWVFGAYDTKRLAIGSGDGTDRRRIAYNAGAIYANDDLFLGGPHTFFANSTGVGIDGQKMVDFSNFSTSSNILLYTIPLNSTTYRSNARIWSYKHYRNGVLVRDLIPVRVGNVGELYDRVTGTLMERHGTLIIGPDK